MLDPMITTVRMSAISGVASGSGTIRRFSSAVVTARANKLQVEVLQGIRDKTIALTEWARARGIPLNRIAYLGNDVNDLGALGIVGWPIAVASAVPQVLGAARIILTANGGDGAVRELADRVLASASIAPLDHKEQS